MEDPVIVYSKAPCKRIEVATELSLTWRPLEQFRVWVGVLCTRCYPVCNCGTLFPASATWLGAAYRSQSSRPLFRTSYRSGLINRIRIACRCNTSAGAACHLQPSRPRRHLAIRAPPVNLWCNFFAPSSAPDSSKRRVSGSWFANDSSACNTR